MSIPASTVVELTEEIDGLLERYLHLLDQYATLRAELSSLSSSVSLLSTSELTSLTPTTPHLHSLAKCANSRHAQWSSKALN
jgi:hypothetical protein